MARLEAQYNPLLKSYPDSDKINAVSEGAEVLFVRLIAQSDDAGRYYGEPKFVLAKLFTSRMASGQLTVKKIEDRIKELEAVGLVERYEVGGVRYIQLVKAFKTVRKERGPKLRFPVPGHSVGTNQCPDGHQSGTPDQTRHRPDIDIDIDQTDSPPIPFKLPFLIPLPRTLDTPEFTDSWNAWLRYVANRTNGRPSQDTLTRQLTKLATYGPAKASALLDEAITQGWGGPVWPEQKHGANKQPQPIPQL